ncbi:hypothetical protein ACODH8_10035 [Vagococcus fluvialis]|uniref:hypothetical protein n=1 Tax=Vagococcus fluvialis TaxID=2738 RepID=UPI003B58EAC1
MEISSNEIKILKSLRYEFLTIRIPNQNMNKEMISNKTKIDFHLVVHCVDHLLDAGYIRKTIFGTDENSYFELTPKGSNLLDEKKYDLKSKILWNVITPVVLSVITTLITLWFNSLSK